MSNPAQLLDPDCLAFVARALEQANDDAGKTRRPAAQSSLEVRLVQRQADVLDSIARILVSQPRNQVVAVVAQLLQSADRDGNTTLLLVAENSDRPLLPSVITHLRDVFDRLTRIRAALPPALTTEKGFPPFIDSDTELAHERELVGLEEAILKYSWSKFRQRLTKNNRHKNFISVVADIYGVSAEQRTSDLDQVERDSLHLLQNYNKVDSEQLMRVADVIRKFSVLMEMPGAPTEDHIEYIRPHLHLLHTDHKELQGHGDFFAIWNQYSQHRLEKGGKKLKKELDVFGWLSKVVSITEHYVRITTLASSPTLSSRLLDVVKIQGLNNPIPQTKPIFLDRAGTEEVLGAAGREVSGDDGVDGFLAMLADAHGAQLSEGTLAITHKAPVHCECALLAAIHGRPAIPYIGVSKPSCACCETYFTAYRDATGSKIYTRGGSQNRPWTYPVFDLDAELDATIRAQVTSKLLAKIRNGWDMHRRTSKSTSASGEERRWSAYPDTLDMRLAAVKKVSHLFDLEA
ncbi:hypothetical protein FB451DRAFT_1484373 [Mycena latifolia]|nr:hypothetical protein FB451DRAFT_1484373 [Mycena latifolia]